MPIVDNDLIQVHKATRTGSTNIEFEFTWTTESGEDRGRIGVSFATAAELREFLGMQGSDDVARAVLGQCINKTTGALSGATFDGLAGKQFRVRQRVQQV